MAMRTDDKEFDNLVCRLRKTAPQMPCDLTSEILNGIEKKHVIPNYRLFDCFRVACTAVAVGLIAFFCYLQVDTGYRLKHFPTTRILSFEPERNKELNVEKYMQYMQKNVEANKKWQERKKQIGI